MKVEARQLPCLAAAQADAVLQGRPAFDWAIAQVCSDVRAAPLTYHKSINGIFALLPGIAHGLMFRGKTRPWASSI